jgi:hypothetical protein
VSKLHQGREEVHRQFAALRERWFLRTYHSDRAREFAHQGFCRRLDTMVHAIDLVFEILPPEREDIPEKDDVVGATICIQSFVFNAFGCLDNLAWIWVHEKELKGQDGNDLKAQWVGLGKSYRYVRDSFSKEFRAYLKSRQKWLAHLTGFRDSPHVPQSCECGLLLPSRFWRRSAHCIGRSHIELGSSLSINF